MSPSAENPTRESDSRVDIGSPPSGSAVSIDHAVSDVLRSDGSPAELRRGVERAATAGTCHHHSLYSFTGQTPLGLCVEHLSRPRSAFPVSTETNERLRLLSVFRISPTVYKLHPAILKTNIVALGVNGRHRRRLVGKRGFGDSATISPETGASSFTTADRSGRLVVRGTFSLTRAELFLRRYLPTYSTASENLGRSPKQAPYDRNVN